MVRILVHEHCKLKRYIWELPVRWCHWVNVLCLVILAITGAFIAHPYSIGQDASQFVMGWFRFVHFLVAYIFTISVVVRIVWSFAGNRYAGWREFFPMATEDGRKKMREMFRYYLFMTHKVPETVGHNPLAATAYFAVYCIYVAMIATGFAMYAQYAPGGMMHRSFGFVYALFSIPALHLIHHGLPWLLLGFVINHIYSAWLMDIKEHGAEISSIFSGYKFTLKHDDE